MTFEGFSIRHKTMCGSFSYSTNAFCLQVVYTVLMRVRQRYLVIFFVRFWAWCRIWRRTVA